MQQVKSIAECSEHSAIPSTFIKLPFVIKIFVLSIFEVYCTISYSKNARPLPLGAIGNSSEMLMTIK